MFSFVFHVLGGGGPINSEKMEAKYNHNCCPNKHFQGSLQICPRPPTAPSLLDRHPCSLAHQSTESAHLKTQSAHLVHPGILLFAG